MNRALLLLVPWLAVTITACPPGTSADDTDDTGPTADPEDDDGDGFSEADGDCDDADDTIHPGAPEVPYDGVDNDCQDGDTLDADGDGYDASWFGGDDCDDADAAVHPGAAEVCGDAVDQDCSLDPDDGATDADGDGFVSDDCTGGDDCDDGSASAQPGMAVAVPADFATPAEAAAAVCGGSTITVSAGTYTGVIDGEGKALSFIAPAGAYSTFLVGDGTGTVLTLGEVGGESLVSGFTIRGGIGEFGGGVACTGTCTIEDTAFTTNEASYGAGLFLADADFTVASCSFASSTALYGAGIHVQDSVGTITSSVFNNLDAERGGGAVSVWYSDVNIAAVGVQTSEAGQGGGVYFYLSDGAIANASFTTCRAESGGGVWSREATLELNTNSFTDNYGTWGGAGYYCWDSTVSALETNTFSGNDNRGCDDYSTTPCIDVACRNCSGCE